MGDLFDREVVRQVDGEAGISGVLLLVDDGVEAGAELEEKPETQEVLKCHGVLLKING